MNDYIGATGNYPIIDIIDLSSNNNFIFTSNINSNLNKRIDNINLQTSNYGNGLETYPANISLYYIIKAFNSNDIFTNNIINTPNIFTSLNINNNLTHRYIFNSTTINNLKMGSEKTLVIGMFGFGVVGEGLYKILKQTPSLKASIKKVCIKNTTKKRNAR